jgi:hypothetical protein
MQNLRTPQQALVRIFVRPLFPFVQWFALATRLNKGPKSVEGSYRRQPYLLGRLKGGVSPDEAKARLQSQGFYINRIAYIDPGQVLSMRRLDEDNPVMQYHIRIFDDGEVRGHYEYTPEDRPFKHMDEAILEKRPEIFRSWVAPLVDNIL